MKEVLFSIGPINVYGYGFMIAIGIITAYMLIDKRTTNMKNGSLYSQNLTGLFIITILGGFLGAKLLYFITIIDEIVKNPKMLLSLSGGFVVYGGLIVGGLVAFIYTKIRKMNFIDVFDLVIPGVALAQGFGRIGCLLSGCCYGAETTSKFSIMFHNSSCAPNNVKLYPTQIMSSVLDFINFAILMIVDKKIKKRGLLSSIYMINYSIGRFFLEYFRGDLERGFVGNTNLSTSQFIAIFMLIFGISWCIICIKKDTKNEVN